MKKKVEMKQKKRHRRDVESFEFNIQHRLELASNSCVRPDERCVCSKVEQNTLYVKYFIFSISFLILRSIHGRRIRKEDMKEEAKERTEQ